MRKGWASHGFVAVDTQVELAAWVRTLDILRKEPFYAAYKKRTVELLAPRRGGVYLDIGAGTGDDVREMAQSADAAAFALDLSRTMMQEAMRRGLRNSIVADAAFLPFAENSFDGCRADRTFQHMTDPDQALREMVRVTKPRGRLVAVDPDYGSQLLEFPDQRLAQRVLQFRANHGLQNGTMARSMPGMFSSAGVSDVYVEAMTLVVRDPGAVDNVMGLKTWAGSACSAGYLSEDEVRRWEELFDKTVAEERFMYALTFILTAGTKWE